jgi:hypothetical protein
MFRSNPIHGEVYSIQPYVIKFVSDLRQVLCFSPGTPVSSTNETDRHDIAQILLKVVLNIINPKPSTKGTGHDLCSSSLTNMFYFLGKKGKKMFIHKCICFPSMPSKKSSTH